LFAARWPQHVPAENITFHLYIFPLPCLVDGQGVMQHVYWSRLDVLVTDRILQAACEKFLQ
jgi:hypothetical protein